MSKISLSVVCLLLFLLLALSSSARKVAADDDEEGTKIMWISHLEFIPGGPQVVTTFNSTNSGVGGGLSGLIIQSTTAGDTFPAPQGGNKVVEQALEVPPGFLITGVRVCYELSNTRSFIDQVRLAQLHSPPSMATVLLDDATHLNAAGPTCHDSTAPPGGPIDPAKGDVRLDLRIFTAAAGVLGGGGAGDKIVVRGVALKLVRQED
jgi:hypothetical protein